MRRQRTFLSVLLHGSLTVTSLTIAGCSTIEALISSSPEPASVTAPEDVPSVKSRREGVMVTWDVPSEAVDGFILRYGLSPRELVNEVRLRTTELKEEKDPSFGPVFRYTIPDVPPGTDIFVAVAAFKGDRLSDFSETMREPAHSIGN